MANNDIVLNKLNIDDLFSSNQPKENNQSTEVPQTFEKPKKFTRENESFDINSEETKQKSTTIASEEIQKKSSSFSEDELLERLKQIFPDDKDAAICSSLINLDAKGFRGFFVGSMTGTKGIALKQLNFLLYDIGKVSKDRYVHISFNELENLESWDTQTLYVISNLSDAYIKLFAKDQSEEEDEETAKYERVLEFLLNAPLNAYIILDASDNISKKNFLNIDPRINFLFSKQILFEDYSDERIAEDLIKKLQGKSNVPSQDEIINFLDANRRYYPFKNDELTNYLALNFEDTGALPPNKEDTFDLEAKLSVFIGMEDAKNIVRRMYKYLKARKLFEEKGVDIRDAEFSLSTIFLGEAGTGKCLTLDEPILTPNGWIRNGDIEIGDEVYDHCGNIVNVTGTFPNGEKDLYKITFDDGTSVEATLDHQWLVQDKVDRENKLYGALRKPSYKVLTTKQIIDTELSYLRSDGYKIRKYSIPVASPIPFKKQSLPLDPYFLGVFMMSGVVKNREIIINLNNDDVKDRLLSIDNLSYTSITSSKMGETSFIVDFEDKSSSLFKELLKLGLIKNDSIVRTIPNQYLFSSIDQRKLLLNGIADLATHSFSGSKVLFNPYDELFTDSILTLTRSLGSKSYVRKDNLISVLFPDNISWIFTSKKRQDSINSKPARKYKLCKYIENIEYSRKSEVQCISVANFEKKFKKGDVVDEYRVFLSSGKVLDFNSADLLETQDISDRLPVFKAPGAIQRYQSSKLMSPEEIFDTPLFNHRQTLSLFYTRDENTNQAENLPIHPYILGVILGDGHLGETTTTIANSIQDKEIIDTVSSFLPKEYKISQHKTTPDRCPIYSIIKTSRDINQLSFQKKIIVPLGLGDALSGTKFIPEIYLNSSLENRIWLLKGLMDTDGTTDGSTAYYSSTSLDLAHGVQRLVHSLGGKANISSKSLYTGNTAYCVTINFPREYAFTKIQLEDSTFKEVSNVFNLKRKADLYNPVRNLSNFKDFIVDIEKIGTTVLKKDVFAEQNSTYLCHDYIVTHNTSLARVLAELYYDLGFLSSPVMVEMVGTDLMGSTEAISARKTAKAIQDAMGGVLFIDEAYSLVSDAAIATLVKNLTDHRGEFALFAAGYFIEMSDWLNLNSGLKSRMGTYINIQNYNEEELYQIFELKASRLGLKIIDSPELRAKLDPIIGFCIRTHGAGNGRFIERLMQATLLKMSEEYFADPRRDISIIDAEVIPDIADIIKTAA